MKKRQFARAAESSQTSNTIKSVRRIFFNHLDHTIEERGHFHVDQTFGSGSGILIRKSGVFYLLTARHVLQNTTNFEFANDSPFWVTALNRYQVNSIYDFMMPARLHFVGDLIADRGVAIDTSDLVMVELFKPLPQHQPDSFLDFDAKVSPMLPKEKFFSGQLLFAAGYPFERNIFTFIDEPRDGFTHETRVQRHIINGQCVLEDGEPYMTALTNAAPYENMSGASGGIVCNMQNKGNQVRALGMIISGGPRIIRFLPSYLIQEAIDRLNEAKSIVIDSAVVCGPDFQAYSAALSEYQRYLREGQ
jgi:hypothetical protein